MIPIDPTAADYLFLVGISLIALVLVCFAWDPFNWFW
jgi:hypothetical protein